METNRIQFLTDEEGRRVAVQLPLDRYEALVEAAEDLNDLRAYLMAKAEPDQEMLSYNEVRMALGLVDAQEDSGSASSAS